MESHKDDNIKSDAKNNKIKSSNKKQIVLIALISIVFIAVIVASFSFFGKKNSFKKDKQVSQKNNPGAVFSSVQNKDNTSTASGRSVRVYENADAEDKKTKKLPPVDLDLTKLSGDFVYAEVNNMMTTPEKYEGKIIKMKGYFNFYRDDLTGKSYTSCIIQDAQACCKQGIEFILQGGVKTYPDDFPRIGQDLMIIGKFKVYKEGEQLYCHLVNATAEF